MKKHAVAVPEKLQTRINALAESQHSYFAVFEVSSNTALNIERIVDSFRRDIKGLYGHGNYSLAWFRCDGNIVLALSGSKLVVHHLLNFVFGAPKRKLFDNAHIVYQGSGVKRFLAEVDKLLENYSAPFVSHSFGGSN